MINGKEKIFKCKIGFYYYFIKVFLINKQINIEIEANSIKTNRNSKYFNNYTLSHFQEINPYFNFFQSIKDVYKDFLRILNEKHFMISQHEDNTISLYLHVRINNKTKKINLTLTRYKGQDYFEQKKIFNDSDYKYDLNDEINNIKNKIDLLEKSYFQKYTNNYIPTNSSSVIPNSEYNQLETIISKLNQLENENNEKNEQIKLLENKLNKYQKYYDNYNEEDEEKEESEETYEMNNKENKMDNYNMINNSKKYINKDKKINRYNSFDKDYNLMNRNYYNMNDEYPKKEYNYNHKNTSIEQNFNKVKTDIIRRNNLKSSLSMDYIPDKNYTKMNTYMPSSKVDKYLNNIRPIKKENILNLNSKIIFTNKEAKLIVHRLSEDDANIKVELKLLYRATRDGDYEDAIKLRCDKKLKTLTLFYTIEGARFGIYIEKKIKSTIKSGKKIVEVPGTSFIISLNNLIYYNVRMKENSLDKIFDNYLCFGFSKDNNIKNDNNHKRWLIYTSRNNFLGKKFLFRNKNDVYLNLDYRKIIGNNLSYHIKEVEMFEVIYD